MSKCPNYSVLHYKVFAPSGIRKIFMFFDAAPRNDDITSISSDSDRVEKAVIMQLSGI